MNLKNKIRFGLKTRFIIYILIFFVFLNGIIIYLYFTLKKRISLEIEKSLNGAAKIILIHSLNDNIKSYIFKAENPSPDNSILKNLTNSFLFIKKELKLDNIHLIDNNLKILATTGLDYSSENLKLKKDEFEIREVFKTGSQKISELFESYEGKNILICYSPVDIFGMTGAVLAVEASNELLGVFNRLFDDILITTAISFAFILFISVMFSKYILKPIDKIVRYVKSVSTGNFNSKIVVSKRADEINFLAESFNEMVENILALNKALKEKESAATIRAEIMESKLKESERLYFLGTMAAVVAHEIRNPLSGISGFLELLERKIEKNEHTSRLVNKIKIEIEKLNKVTTDFLFLSADKKIEKKKIYLAEIIKNCISLLEPELLEKKISISEIIPEDIFFYGDETYFEKAVYNVLLNSISAIEHKNGFIEIKAFKDADLDSGFNLIISDNGRGFDNADKDKLFDIFYTTKESGTGLGLTIIKRIVEMHNGSIDITCENNITSVKIKI